MRWMAVLALKRAAADGMAIAEKAEVILTPRNIPRALYPPPQLDHIPLSDPVFVLVKVFRVMKPL